MQIRKLRIVLSLLMTLCVCRAALAQQAGRIESMKLLTPSVGWAATSKKIFLTTDGGAQWKDITPKLNYKQQRVSSVFFLDSSTGWALLRCGDDRNPIADDICFEFASTTNAGENWSVVHPKIVDPVPQSVIVEDGQGFSGTTFLDFADAQHGWAILKRNLHVEASAGQMLRTLDGGKTWTQLPKDTLPIADHFRFASAKDGWVAGGGQPESDLYVTHDGGDTWSRVVVTPPTAIKVEVWPPAENGVWPDYQLPFFGSPARGFLIGSYWDGSKPIPALFSTTDLGRMWKFERTLPGIDGVTTISRETLFVVSTPQSMNKLTLTRLPLGEGSSARASLNADVYGIPLQHYNLGANSDTLDMLDDTRGWLLADELLATSDGGATWIDITPAEARPAGGQDAKPKKVSTGRHLASPGQTALSGAPPAVANVSTHLGFDKSRVPCPTAGTCTSAQSLTTMQVLMTSSPYYDTSVYIPGSPNRGSDAAMNQSWVQGAEQQGWGFVPTWFGLQSSCIINQPNVKQYFGPNAADASTQGAEQADQAVAAAKALGLPAGIIYTDIENYTVNSTCSPLVQAYVDGFVTEIHVYSGYLAGIYANPGPIKSDIHNANVAQADAIWITKVTTPPQVTIWNQGINDALWPNGQRMHQFLIDQAGVIWGGVTFSPSVDDDIDNGPVVNANNGTKNYSSNTLTTLQYPTKLETAAYGINDIWDGAFVNGPGETGEIVGGYYDGSTRWHGFLLDGLIAWSTIDYPGATTDWATGINKLGQIVGTWEDSGHCLHGYLLEGGTYTSIDHPNGVCGAGGNGGTWATGINDAGQIVGYYSAINPSSSQAFLYYLGKFYSISLAGSCCYNASDVGINGDADAAGSYSNAGSYNGFVDPLVPPSWSGTYSSFFDAAGLETVGQGINNDGDVAGYYELAYLNDVGILYTNNLVITSFQCPSPEYDTYAAGVNDFGQAIGWCGGSMFAYLPPSQ